MGPILVVDDNYDFRLMLRQLLEQRGYHVISVATAAQAMDLVMKQALSLIITDIYLPGMNGFELMRRIQDRGRNRPPIIAVSGYDFLNTPEARARANVLGAYALLGKPVDFEVLMKAVAGALTDGTGDQQALEEGEEHQA